ncbi:MAG: hypothetical protein L6V93_22305 [Clostridiales bacterium]|nr:MAG: hypothetical protein L6V93_22305 [Clostridiales bacterium]
MFTDIQTRVVSTFGNPNVLGEYLLLMIPAVCAFVWNAPKIGNRVVNLLPLGLFGTLYDFSRIRAETGSDLSRRR